MSDFLSSAFNTQNNSYLDSQMSRNETTQEEFNFSSYIDSQSQTGQLQFENKFEKNEKNLEVIKEEDSYQLTQQDYLQRSANKYPGNGLSIQSKMDGVINQISQEIDQLCEEASQRKEHQISKGKHLMNSDRNQNFYPGNNKQAQIQMQQTFTPANSFMQKNSSFQAKPSANIKKGNENKSPNLLTDYKNSNKTKAKNVTPIRETTMNCNKRIEFQKNEEDYEAFVQDFRNRSQEMINNTISMFDSFKTQFCDFIEEHKIKFIKDSSFIQELLIAETLYVLTEEERNKTIDARMEMLFKEMMNILNEFQGIRNL